MIKKIESGLILKFIMLGNLKLWLKSQEFCSVSVLNFLQGLYELILAFASPNYPSINFRLKKKKPNHLLKELFQGEVKVKCSSFCNVFIDGKNSFQNLFINFGPTEATFIKIQIASQKKLLVELLDS